MGDYKRFISYIYSYEKGIKSKNSGFAKVESRDGICKINISLRIDDILMGDSSDNTLIVFLYRQMDNEFRKIKIGNIEISKAASVFKAQVDSKNICDSGMEIDEIDGIFICISSVISSGYYFVLKYNHTSNWDFINFPCFLCLCYGHLHVFFFSLHQVLLSRSSCTHILLICSFYTTSIETSIPYYRFHLYFQIC